MLYVLITIIASFFVSSLFGYLVHRMLHQTWAGILHQKHMTHHITLYPPSDYLSEEYRYAGKDNTTITFAIAAIPVVAAPIILGLIGWISLPLVLISLTIMGLMGFLHSYLHDAFHIKNHWLNKVPIINNMFLRWNILHYYHHIDMSSNFGIFVFHWDYVFFTFKK